MLLNKEIVDNHFFLTVREAQLVVGSRARVEAISPLSCAAALAYAAAAVVIVDVV